MNNDKIILIITINVNIINIILDDSVPFIKTTISKNLLIIIAIIGNIMLNTILFLDFLFILTIKEIIAQNIIILENTVAV